jgi:hypothetical protein
MSRFQISTQRPVTLTEGFLGFTRSLNKNVGMVSNRVTTISFHVIFKLLRIDHSIAGLVTGVVGSNPAKGMDVCLCVSVLCSPL